MKFIQTAARMATAMLCLYGMSQTVKADVKLAVLFGDNLVLQRGMPVPVWGTADAGESVTVSVNGQKATATADASGKWVVKLPAMTAGGPYDMTVAGKNTITVKNIAIGEVWIASGQSNMEFPLKTWSPADNKYAKEAAQEIAAANDPMLRMFYVIKKVADKPQDSVTGVKGQWEPTNPQSANGGGFSSVAYYFAKDLREKLKVPVGIIHSSWGGTPAEAWTSRGALEACPELKEIVTRWDKTVTGYVEAKKKYEEVTIPKWKADCAAAKAAGKPEPKRPGLQDPTTSPHRESSLYNGMIAPLLPYAIAGAIWYQGESNAGNAKQYRTLFPEMIKDWRAKWGQGDFPFYFVQLANFQARQTKPAEGGWAPLREAQTMTLSLPNTGMAVAIDLADADNPGDIHPHDKRNVGLRLSLNALAKVYGQQVEYAGPMYESMKVEGSAIRINFTHADGLAIKGGDKVEGFAIAGADGKYEWATAKIDGTSVIVSSDKVAEPKNVRYNWASNPFGNLYNKSNLPANPFRTDPDSAQ